MFFHNIPVYFFRILTTITRWGCIWFMSVGNGIKTPTNGITAEKGFVKLSYIRMGFVTNMVKL